MTPSSATLFITSHASDCVIWVFLFLSRPGYNEGHITRMTKWLSVVSTTYRLSSLRTPVKRPCFSMTIACAHRQAPQMPPGWYQGCLLYHLLLSTMVSAAVLMIENHVRCSRQNPWNHEEGHAKQKEEFLPPPSFVLLLIAATLSEFLTFQRFFFYKTKYSCYLDKKHLQKAVFIKGLFANWWNLGRNWIIKALMNSLLDS